MCILGPQTNASVLILLGSSDLHFFFPSQYEKGKGGNSQCYKWSKQWLCPRKHLIKHILSCLLFRNWPQCELPCGKQGDENICLLHRRQHPWGALVPSFWPCGSSTPGGISSSCYWLPRAHAMDGTACQSASTGLAGKKAQQLRTAVALSKDSSSGPSTHLYSSQPTITGSRASGTLFWLLWVPTCMWQTGIWIQIHRKTKTGSLEQHAWLHIHEIELGPLCAISWACACVFFKE